MLLLQKQEQPNESLTAGNEAECAPFDPQFCFVAKWTPPPGVYATLEPTSRNILLTLPGLDPFWVDAGLGTPIDSYDFPSFVLTMKDGTRYVVERENLGEHFVEAEPGVFIFVEAFGDGKLTQIIDRNGNTTVIGTDSIDSFNAEGVLTKSVIFQRDFAGRIVGILDPNQQAENGTPAVTYEYDLEGNLFKVNKLQTTTPTVEYATTMLFYENTAFPHFITEIIDPLGHGVMRTEYDDDGRIVAIVDVFGKRTELGHNLGDRTETTTDALGGLVTYVYDTQGNIVAMTDALGHTSTATFDDSDNPTSSTDPLGDSVTFTYDQNGNVLTETDALGNTTSFTYDAFGNILTSTDPFGNTTSGIFDSNGNLAAFTDALGNTKTYNYNANGNLVSSVNTLGIVEGTFDYDSAGNVTSVTDIIGITTDIDYNANGDITNTSRSWVNPSNPNDVRIVTTETFYDAAGQVTRQISPDGTETETTYDVSGRPIEQTDVLGNVTRQTYDARGSLIQADLAPLVGQYITLNLAMGFNLG